MLPVSRATIAIPARIGSRRIPNKPLTLIDGKPLVLRVVEQALRVECAREVVVVTDSHDVADVVAGKCDVLLETRPAWCGTNRIGLAWHRAPSLFPTPQEPTNVVINWQIGEPFVRPDDVARLVTLIEFNADRRKVVTLVAPIRDQTRLFTESLVKARIRRERDMPDRATRFCRAGGGSNYRLHVGVYGFAATALAGIGTMERTRRAKAADLEQVAWLEGGYQIQTVEIAAAPDSINSMEDVERLNGILWRPTHVRIDARKVTA